MTNSAILLIIFNRPRLTRSVFQRIRGARPVRLYVAADGPRHSHPDDPRLTSETREIIAEVDWPCKVNLLFRDNNLGCRKAVSGALDWFFKHETEGIILEDDCLPARSFFGFCDELLEKYRDDSMIAQISGSNFLGKQEARGASYFFSHYPDIWGWATWRRSWAFNDTAMGEWPAFRKARISQAVNGGLLENVFWTKNFERTWTGEIDTWDYQWMFSVWRRGGLNIVPALNQVENLGFGKDATHTLHPAPRFIKPVVELELPLVHPHCKKVDKRTDRRISRTRYSITFTSKIASIARSCKPLRELVLKLKTFRSVVMP